MILTNARRIYQIRSLEIAETYPLTRCAGEQAGQSLIPPTAHNVRYSFDTRPSSGDGIIPGEPTTSFTLDRHVAFRLGRVFALALLTVTLQCSGAFAQGFSANKKTITLHRKLPAVVRLPGTAIDIRPVVRNQANGDLVQALSDMLLVTLQKNDTRLHVDKNSPDVVIAYSIITYQTPPLTTYNRQETQYQNKRLVQVPVQYYKATGELTIAYQAADAHRKILDAGPITTKYSQDFQAGTNQAAGGSGTESVGSFASKINPFGFGKKKTEENTGPPNPVQLRQKLLDGVVSQLAARLVNTEETVDVMLAQGKPFDDANKLAEKGQWTRYLEALETMTPLPNPADDAYRLYNIGVANEALAYQAEDKASIQKFLGEAAIKYGKAIDAKPSEKYFVDPQTRIETAVAHYKKLSEGANTRDDAEAASKATGNSLAGEGNSANASSNTTRGTTDSGPASTKGVNTGSKSTTDSTKGGSASTRSAAAGSSSKRTASPTKPSASKPSGPPLTNPDIIKMAKAGVDEDSMVAAIQDAAKVNFDLSPDGLVTLASAGVKGKVLSAMRVRAKQSQRHATSPSSN